MNNELTMMPADIKYIMIDGFICVCSWCQKTRDTKMKWHWIDTNQIFNSGYEITHGICPECLKDSQFSLEQLEVN